MEIIFENQFVIFLFDKENSIFSEVWKSETADMPTEEAKNVLIKLIEFLNFYKPTRYLSDAKFLFRTISPEMQRWADENIAAVAVKNGLMHFARIIPDDFFTQISMIQFSEEKNLSKIENQFFKDTNEAIKWLCEK